MCVTHMSVLGVETQPVPELRVSACVHLCVFWNVPGLIGRLRNAEHYLSPGEAGLECGPILLSAVTCRFTLHTSPARLHFQFRARFHSFTRTCVMAAGVEVASRTPTCAHACAACLKAQKSLSLLHALLLSYVFQPKWNPVFPLQTLKTLKPDSLVI